MVRKEIGLYIIPRLRDDAVLHYAPPPKKEGQVRRPKKYGDRFSARNPDAGQLPCIAQTEFFYRDAQQHTGLEDTQSRHPKALEYHFNMALLSVSVAKIKHHLSINKTSEYPFPMADFKTQYFNEPRSLLTPGGPDGNRTHI
ncbi:MAG TPA: hypothetical protein PK228_04085 [Saprospiraceae bacterium]|nr:hypothetical protein [Saprospiraceae bacterium]